MGGWVLHPARMRHRRLTTPNPAGAPRARVSTESFRVGARLLRDASRQNKFAMCEPRKGEEVALARTPYIKMTKRGGTLLGCTLATFAKHSQREILGAHLHRLQLRDAAGVLQGFDGVFGREPAHKLCQLTVGCHVDRCRINSLHVLGGASTASVHFHNKLDVLHALLSLMGNG